MKPVFSRDSGLDVDKSAAQSRESGIVRQVRYFPREEQDSSFLLSQPCLLTTAPLPLLGKQDTMRMGTPRLKAQHIEGTYHQSTSTQIIVLGIFSIQAPSPRPYPPIPDRDPIESHAGCAYNRGDVENLD